MSKRKAAIIIALAVVLSLSFTVFALASDTQAAKSIRWFFGIDTSKLTDQQKADLEDSLNKMAELQKENASKMADLQREAINKMVENGSMTKEQGDAAIQRIEERLKKIEENGFPMGIMIGKGWFRFFGKDGFSSVTLTDAQKADLKDSFIKLANLQKEAISKMVANGSISKETGDNAIKKIDEMISNYDNGNYPMVKGMGYGGIALWGIKGLNMQNLSDQQKADLKDYMVKAAEIQKEIINKMASNGALTKEQAESFISRIDDMVNNIAIYCLKGGFGMYKGGLRENKKAGTF